jgi:hypothetical protein
MSRPTARTKRYHINALSAHAKNNHQFSYETLTLVYSEQYCEHYCTLSQAVASNALYYYCACMLDTAPYLEVCVATNKQHKSLDHIE